MTQGKPTEKGRAILQAMLNGSTLMATSWAGYSYYWSGDGPKPPVDNRTAQPLLDRGFIRKKKQEWATVHFEITDQGKVAAHGK